MFEQDPPARLRGTKYYFPRLGVITIPISKAGGTSLLRFLIAIETELENNGVISQEFIKSQQSKLAAIAAPWGRSGARFSAQDSSQHPQTANTIIAVIRSPYTRLGSAWLNKFFMASSIKEMRYLQDVKTRLTVDGKEMRDAFYSFLLDMRKKPEILMEDTHLRPQTESLGGIADIDMMIGLRQLVNLPTMIQARTGITRIKEVKMPHENSTRAELATLLWSESSLNIAEELYARDHEYITVCAKEFPHLISELKRPPIANIGIDHEIPQEEVLKLYLSRTLWAYTTARTEKKQIARQLEQFRAARTGLLTSLLSVFKRTGT